MESKKMFGLVCSKCKETYEVYLTNTELEEFLANDPKSECCDAELKREWAFGLGKFNAPGFTRRHT